MSLLTEEQRLIFEKVLDYNHEVNDTSKTGVQRMEALGKLTQAKEDLRKSMGQEAYDNFMSMGKKMFAPKEESRKTTDDGDEFLNDDDY